MRPSWLITALFAISVSSIFGWGLPQNDLYFICVGFIGILSAIILYLFERKSIENAKSNEATFPEIKLDTLKSWANDWISKFQNLNSVYLYKAPSGYLQGVRYVLWFKFNKTPTGEQSERSFQYFTERIPEMVLDDGFHEVYRRTPSQSFREEWTVITYQDVELRNAHKVVLIKKRW